ncbi:hypothetical protein IHE45_03G009800 [Dioscorea alata]|uniref:Uncharacterized protein n=1 Tax=Dioscorea alata TaxID=55571 RepID=A0ACB7WJH9_DIOAL|nr:hypothetical protein IHE45_03G009800 [Dioscorea alata]
MKSVCLACCFLILAIHISPSPTAEARLLRRQLASFQPFEPVVAKEKTEILDKTSGSTTQHIGGDEGLVYFVDYHGVETHPSPRTKHPKP